MPVTDTMPIKGIKVNEAVIHHAYMHNDYYPIWLANGYKPSDAAEKYMAELPEVTWDGLNPEQYKWSALRALKDKLGKKNTTIEDALAFDTLLTESYLAVAKDLLLGKLVPKKADSLWFHANDSAWNAPQQIADVQIKYISLDSFRSTVPTYKLLRDEYKRYSALAADTVLKDAIQELSGAASEGSEESIRTIISRKAPWIKPLENDSLSELKQLVLGYQEYAGIKPTGTTDSTTLKQLCATSDTVLRKIAANMERIRWMQRQFGNLYVFVNVPLMQLFFRKDGLNAMHMRVVVGKPERQTPTVYALMTNVVLNPPWGVPSTILKQDVLPGIEKSGSAYLRRKGLKIYNKKGDPVSVTAINEKNYRKFTYKQAPGDDNSLGYVKFNLPNPFDIYLHDTPHRGDFVKRFRALSSGCVRLEHPQEMAVFVLADLEKKDFTQEKLDNIIKTHKTQWKILHNKIPVHIAYLTAFEDTTGSHINFINDVYHRDEKVMAMLAKK